MACPTVSTTDGTSAADASMKLTALISTTTILVRSATTCLNPIPPAQPSDARRTDARLTKMSGMTSY
jgi:hypothetical protein